MSVTTTRTTDSQALEKLHQSSHFNIVKPSRLHFFRIFAQTILLTPFTTTARISCRFIKLVTWDLCKSTILKLLGFHHEADAFYEEKYLKTMGAVRDLLFIISVAASAFQDMIAKNVQFKDDLQVKGPESYLQNVKITRTMNTFSSHMFGRHLVEMIQPEGIKEFAAESDGALNTVMASHFLKPLVLGGIFGLPNFALFDTREQDDRVQTYKVDAKSLKREKMKYHPTNGKIQSGIFFIPTNLPPEALERFREAAKTLEGRSDHTCVNTNCRVLKAAGFSIEGKRLQEILFPTTLMEHLLFRNFFYTDSKGDKHKVRFDILNTTKYSLEEYYEKIDMAVLGTRMRHQRRNADTEENRRLRGNAAKVLIAEETMRLGMATLKETIYTPDLKKRKVSVSVPSCMANVIASLWGRHTLYEVDFSDKKEMIRTSFEDHKKLKAFPHENPNLSTRVKRDFFFSGPMINFLRRHMMGKTDDICLNPQDLFSHIKSMRGGRLNYVILGDKVVLARIHANGEKQDVHRKAADWALSKHALLAGREDVHCSGEIWYDESKDCFMINGDSGTYMPNEDLVNITAKLANEIFETNLYGNAFEVAPVQN